MDKQQVDLSVPIVNVAGRVINLAHISRMDVDLYEGSICIAFFDGRTLTFDREIHGGSQKAAFDALLRFYHSVPRIEQIFYS